MPRKLQDRPTRCLEPFPASNTIFFCGEFINISIMSMYAHVSLGFISKVFSGKVIPSGITTKKLAEALKMDIGCFITALDDRLDAKRRYKTEVQNHNRSVRMIGHSRGRPPSSSTQSQ